MEFLAGLLLGAILGVAADRIWERIELMPRFKIVNSHSYSTTSASIDYVVTNVGKKDIPEFEITLFHPERGTLHIFNTQDRGPLPPRQERRFSCPVRVDAENWKMLGTWLKHVNHKPIPEPEFKGFLFRCVMVKSDVVLFENSLMGDRLAEHLYRAIQTGHMFNQSFNEAMEAGTPQTIPWRLQAKYYTLRLWHEWVTRAKRLRKKRDQEKTKPDGV